MRDLRRLNCCVVLVGLISFPDAEAQDAPTPLIVRPGLFTPLTEPPCSNCSTQHRKHLIAGDDRVVSWIRGAHNGGAIPLRYFLSSTRVINDTYGLFFFDPDGDYVAAYEKDYGYQFHGWRRGVMVVISAQSNFEINRLRLLIGQQTLIGAVVMGDQTLSRPLQHLISQRVDIRPIRQHLLQPRIRMADLLADFWSKFVSQLSYAAQ